MPFTEYEIGAQKIAEAIHCAIGSVSKYTHSQKMKGEEGSSSRARGDMVHVCEELGIVKNTIREYSKDIYGDMVERSADSKYTKATLVSIPESSEKLKSKIGTYKEILMKDEEISDEAKDLVEDMYRFLFRVADDYEKCTVLEEGKLKCQPLKDNKFRYLGRVDDINERVGEVFGQKCDV